MVVRLLILNSLLLLGACFEKAKNPVEVTTKGIYDPVEVTVDGSALRAVHDLDEFVKGGDARIIPIEIVNRSGYPVLQIQLDFLDVNVSNYDYATNDLGQKEFPGMDGTCPTDVLPSGQSCVINLQFTSLVTAQITQKIRLRYKNIVEPGDETFELTVFSGDPASLVFVPDNLNYHFGELTGAAQTPLVERDERLTREKVLTVTNAGELRARDLKNQLSQNCSSKLDGSCPAGQENAYEVVDYNCPKELHRGETCSFKMKYTNRNQGADPILKDVSYNSTYKIGYERDPHKSLAGLNSYFKSTSANIEAFLETSLNTLEFEDALVVGNRAKKSFRVKNTGYREGYFRRFNIYEDGSNTLIFYCQKGADPILDCFEADGDPASLENLPIFFTDTQGCMNSTMDKDFPIDTSCIFDVTFQPSVKHLSNGSFNYDIKLDYDTRWLGQEHLTESYEVMLHLNGEWKAAARLVWKDIKFGDGNLKSFDSLVSVEGMGANLTLNEGQFYTIGELGAADIPVLHGDFLNACEPVLDENNAELGTPIGFTNAQSGSVLARMYTNYQGQGKGIVIEPGGGGTIKNGTKLDFSECRMVNWEDLGRLAMQLHEYYETSSVQIRIKNIGGHPAQNIVLTDGDGTVVPNGVPINLGDGTNNCSSTNPDPCYFYQNVSFTCSSLAPSTPSLEFTCAISFNFSPIKRADDDVAQSHDSMFDEIGDTLFENYKAFNVAYNTGEKYLDNNKTGTVAEIGNEEIESRLHAFLVNKGLLSKQTVEIPANPETVAGEYNKVVLSYRNIGTGPITYIHDNLSDLNENTQVVSTSPLPGDGVDCKDIIDWSPPAAPPVTPPGDLASAEKCYLTIYYDVTNAQKADPTDLYSASFKETRRWFNRATSGDDLWEWDGALLWFNSGLRFFYYDGDVSNPDKKGTFSATQGDRSKANNPVGAGTFLRPPSVMPYSVFPAMYGVGMRPEFSKSDLSYGGSTLYSGETVPRTWFYSDLNFDLSEDQVALGPVRNESDNDDALYAYRTIGRAKNVLPYNCSDCDYYIHFGTFKDGASYDLEFLLENMGQSKGIVTNLNVDGGTSDRFALDPASVLTNEELSSNGNVPIQLTFTPLAGDSGIFQGVIEYSVDSQIAIDKIAAPNKIWNYKIEFVAEVVNSYPELSFDYQKYQVTTYEGSPPTEALEPTLYPLVDSYNLDSIPNKSVNSLKLEMVKRENPAADPTSGYMKKRIVVQRELQDVTIEDMFFKFSESDAGQTSLDNYSGLSVTNTCEGATLTAASPTCVVDLSYQPNATSLASQPVLTFVYELAPNQMMAQNVAIELLPKTPGTVTPEATQYQETYGGVDALNDPLAMALDFGDAVYDMNNKVIKFQNIVMENSSADLRASFLKSYQLQNSIVDQSIYPTAGEWTNVSGNLQVPIFQTLYSDNSERLTVYATEGCLYGEIPPGHPDFNNYDHNERGFLGGGYTGCSIEVQLRMNANYINSSLNNRASYDIMKDNYFKLFYYSFDRVEDGYLSFYFKGNVRPDGYTKDTDIYGVLSDDLKNISFTFDEVSPDTPGVGGLVGYRIFYSDTLSSLNDVLANGANYVSGDVMVSDGVNEVFLNTTNVPELSRGKAFYFKVLAIRSNPGYTAGGFPGLPSGQYLSDGNLPTLRVVVPKVGYAYIHQLGAMVKKDMERENGSLAGPFSYQQAAATCSSLPGISISDPSSAKGTRFHKLLDRNIFDVLVEHPEYSSYEGGENYLNVPHWISGSTGNIESIFSGLTGYSPYETSQTFDFEEMFYFRCDDGCEYDRRMGGGFYAQSFQNYDMWVGESVALGHARCSVDVSF